MFIDIIAPIIKKKNSSIYIIDLLYMYMKFEDYYESLHHRLIL